MMEASMVGKKRPTPQEMSEAALANARAAVAKGNRASADHWIKTADNLARVAERVAAEKTPDPFPENVEEIRAEIRARLARACTVSHEVEEWEYRRDVREAVAAYARKHNLPEPPQLEPCPHPENAFAMAAEDGYWPVPSEQPILPPRVRRRLGLPAEDVFDPYESAQEADADETRC
jgi:hypothetical protein